MVAETSDNENFCQKQNPQKNGRGERREFTKTLQLQQKAKNITEVRPITQNMHNMNAPELP